MLVGGALLGLGLLLHAIYQPSTWAVIEYPVGFALLVMSMGKMVSR